MIDRVMIHNVCFGTKIADDVRGGKNLSFIDKSHANYYLL
jgi:hypothetical protein